MYPRSGKKAIDVGSSSKQLNKENGSTQHNNYMR